MNLHSVLSGGYSTDANQQEENAKKAGYVRDGELSNSERQIYYNPKTNHLIHNINGTRTLKDLNTNLQLGLGNVKNTDRYKNETNILERAKKKHNPKSTSVTGSSLGGHLASQIAKPTDSVLTVNKASLPFQRTGNNEKHFRSTNDVVSAFTGNQKHTQNIKTGLHRYNILGNHSTNIIKGKGIIV